MTSTLLYVIASESTGLRSQILVNDVPVKELDGRPVNSETNVNQWIIEGSNRLEIRLALPSDAGRETSAGNARSFQVRLFAGEHGTPPSPEAALVEFIWDPAAQQLGQDLATVFVKDFQVETAFGRWLWQDSPADPLTESDKQQLVQLLAQFHRALTNRDVTLLVQLLKLSSAEMCRALDMQAEMFSMGEQQFFSSLFASDGWQVDPLDEAAIVFEPVAGGRLVRLRRAGGQPALTGKTSDAALTFRFMMGRTGGQWQVLSAQS